MSLRYIREHYGVPAKRGNKVRYRDKAGWHSATIVYGTHQLIVRPDDWPDSRLRFHPMDENLRYESV